MEERITLCNMVVEAGERMELFLLIVLHLSTLSFLSEYRFDISKLEPLVAKENAKMLIDRVYSIGSCTCGKTEDFLAATKVFLASGKKVKVPTFLVPATQKVWLDLYTRIWWEDMLSDFRRSWL